MPTKLFVNLPVKDLSRSKAFFTDLGLAFFGMTEDMAREIYDGLVCESGRAMCEMALAVAKLSKATVVDFAAVTTPVLVVGAECDRIVPAGVVRQTAARYQHTASVEIPGSDHMVFSGASLPVTMGHIDAWIARNSVFSAA